MPALTLAGAPPLVAHVIYRLDYGGLENGLVNLVNRMPAQRYRHAIVCLAGYGSEFRRRLQRTDVEVVSVDKRPGKDVGAYLRTWRILRRLKPDIVHTRNLGTIDMQWIAAAAGVRHRVHGEHGWEASDPRGQDRHNLRIRRACRPVVDLYVPMSQDLARWLERDVRVSPARIRQLYSGVDVEKFRPAVRTAGTEVTIGTVGRLDPVKNQESLLNALRSIAAREAGPGRRVRLVIVGDGPLRAQLEHTARALHIAERVTFLGARSDTAEIMRSFDIFALPSLNEGISNTILEAMATGLPVVAARVGGNPELIVDGATGMLYEDGREDGLSTALLAYLESPELRSSHGAAARVRAMQNFSLDAMVARYVDLYDELLGHATRADEGTAGRLLA